MQKGIVHLLPLLIVLALVAVVVFLVLSGKLQLPKLSQEKKPNVEVKSTYENPLKQETQYVNPFQANKNPFVVGR